MMLFQDYLRDHICIEWDRFDEARGVPDGLRDDAKYIAAQVLEHKEKRPWCKNFTVAVDVTKLNIRFSSLSCAVKDWSGTTSTADVRVRNKYGEDAVLKLYLTKDDFTFRKLIPLIGHELQHWFTYVLNGEEKSESVFADADFGQYNEKLIKQILYYITPDEVNAFVTELTLTIEQERPSSIDEAYDILFKSDLYAGYVALYNRFVDAANSESASEILSIYREVNPRDEELSDAKIIRKIRRQLERARDRLVKVVPRVLLDNKVTVVR